MRYTETLIERPETLERYTASSPIKNLIGDTLSEFVFIEVNDYKVATKEGVLWVGVAYNPDHPDRMFLYIRVNWEDAKWMAYKTSHHKENQVYNTHQTSISMAEKGLIELSAYDKMKELQTKVMEAALNNDGRVGKALKSCGVSLAQHVRWRTTDEEYREGLEVIDEYLVDKTEGKLMDAIDEGSEVSIHFLLKNKGHKRGYGDQRTAHGAGDVEEDKQLPIEALTQEEQKSLEYLVTKMENYQSKQIGTK